MNNYYTGKSVDEAVAAALEALGITLEQADVTVIEEASRGIFGIGAHPAKVMVTKKAPAKKVAEKEKRSSSVSEEPSSEDLDRTVKFLEGLFALLSIPVSIDTSVNGENKIVINLFTANSSQLIGYRGEVLDSLQFLAGAVYNSDKDEYQRLVVDCENYREKREQTLTALANRLAHKAVKTGRKISLEPMNPFERRIIHSAIADFEGVKTESEGKEPNRFVVIIPDGYDPKNDKNFKVKGGEKRGRSDRRDRPKKGERDRREKPVGEKPKKNFGAGVFLGNSLKDKE